MTLDNLVKIRELKQEPPNQQEFDALVKAGSERLEDAKNPSLSYASRFDLSYNASHSLALAALRAAGYRSDKRYQVFQCLAHTTNLNRATIRMFALSHDKRNLAEYEGHFEQDEALLRQLIMSCEALEKAVRKISF